MSERVNQGSTAGRGEPGRRSPAPDRSRAAPVLLLQRYTGNRGVGDILAAARGVLEDPAMVFGTQELRIGGSVGRGGDNDPQDVAHVRARLFGVGYPAGESLEELVEAIKRYQAEVVGMHYPDGRVDPGGRTLRALISMRRAPATPPGPGEAPAAEARPAPAPVPAPAPAAEDLAGGAPPVTLPSAETQPARSQPAEPEAAATGPRPALRDPALEQLVVAARNPAVDGVARTLAALEAKAKGLKKSGRNEEVGLGRDELVAAIGPLRTRIAALDRAGVDAEAASKLKAGFYRAINAISPFYYQHENIILEYAAGRGGEKRDVFNTCNITSLSMALEALGKSAADYKRKELIPPIAEVFSNDIAVKATGKVGTELTGLRLPDYVAMCAIARAMKYQSGTPEEILAGGNLAFGGGKTKEERALGVTNIGTLKDLAKEFGTTPSIGTFQLDDPNAKKRNDAGVLSGHGEKHWKAASGRADRRGQLAVLRGRLERETDARKQAALEKQIAALVKADEGGPPSEGGIEAKIPIADYKRIVMAQLGPLLDQGRQVIVGQFNHYVRLEAVTEDYVIKDDPGSWTRSNMKITWEEARAMGLFWIWMSIR